MLTKMVNGVQIEMSADEEAAIRAEWAANEAKAVIVVPSIEDTLAALVKKTGLTDAEIAAG